MRRFLLFALTALCLLGAQAADELPEVPEVRIGVLAYKGADAVQQDWSYVTRHLQASIPGIRFILADYDQAGLTRAVQSQAIAFAITSSGHYVALEHSDGASRIATLESPWTDSPRQAIGSAIVVRSASPLHDLADLAGKNVMAVAPDAFGGYLGGQIDLRFHFENWKYAFAVEQAGRDGKPTRSLQFFDANGTAVHKIYLRNEPGVAVYDKLVANFRLPQQSAELNVLAVAPKAAEKPDSEIDVKEFQLAWKDMTDVHQFAQIMREFHLTREQALRLAPAGVVERVTPQALRTLLENAAKDKVAIMVFLGNEGLTQIYSGKIEKTMAAGGFFNVLDPDFNLHIRDTALRSGWVVKRGGVTSVEFFDNDGTQVVSFFGVRERGKPQPQAWVDLADSLPKAK